MSRKKQSYEITDKQFEQYKKKIDRTWNWSDLETIFYGSDEISLNALISKLERFQSLYPNDDMYVALDRPYFDDTPLLIIRKKVYETDEEYRDKIGRIIHNEKQRKKSDEEKERALYEKLREKYE